MNEKRWVIIAINELDYESNDRLIGVFDGPEKDVQEIVTAYSNVEKRAQQLFSLKDEYRYVYREYRMPFVITKGNALERLKEVTKYDTDHSIPNLGEASYKEYEQLFKGDIACLDT